MNISEKMRWAAQHKRSLESFIYVEFIDRPPSAIPYLEFGQDADCYTDKTKIHIGMDHFDPVDEDDLFWEVYYVLGHELQHIKSTTDRDWTAAIKSGIRKTCEQIAQKVLHKKVRLVKDSDYEHFMSDVASHGYHLSMKKLGAFVHFVCNSLEDGRIEAIRSKAHRNFFKYMKRFRARGWDSSAIEDFFGGEPLPEEADLDALAKLQIILNQILSLSTTGIYQKHFLAAYGSTALCKEVQTCIPHIARAVTSRTCRGCMKEAEILIDQLSPLLIEASQMDAFEMLMKQLADAAREAALSKYSASSKTEEQGDGLPSEALFGTSVLVVELDEEEYERMKEEAGDEEVENPSVIFVKKGEGESEEDAASAGSAGGKAEESEDEADPSQTGSGSSDETEDESDNSQASGESSGNTEDDPDQNGAGENEPAEESFEKHKGDGDNADNSEEADRTEGFDMKQSKSGEVSEAPEGSGDISEEEIERAIEEAKKAERTPEIEISEDDIRKQSTFADKMSGFKSQKPPKTDTAGIDANYPETMYFEEEERDYVPDLILPVILESKGNALKNKVEALLRQKRKPDERGMRAGTLDAGRLTSLMFSDTSCFKRRGEEIEPDIAGYLLMDNSGSMGNGQDSNRFYCCNAMAIIEHAFSDIMPLKIAAFDAYGSNSVSHVVVKEFDETAPCNFSYNFYSKGRSGCGNKDGYSIRVAIDQLLTRPEEEKVLIIASDGLPSDYPAGFKDGIEDVRSAVEYGRKNGIKIIGLYMYKEQCDTEAEAFEEMYAPEYLLCQLDSLEDELSRVMKSLFR